MTTRDEAENIVRETRASGRPDGNDYADPLSSGPKTDGSDAEFAPAPSDPILVARHVLPEWMHGGRRTIHHWHGSWMTWERTHYREAGDEEVRSWAYRRLENASFIFVNPKGEEEEKRWAPSKKKVADLLEAMSAITHLSPQADAPSWLDGRRGGDAGPYVACANGILKISGLELSPLTPEFFNLVSVPFDYDPGAPVPKAWLAFLAKLWPGDEGRRSVDALQEYFGYILSGRTDLQKILLMVGPTRSGKGTIARILTELVGRGSVVGPSMAGLATDFGLQSLLGKPLAIIPDARLGGKDKKLVVERLLAISGEDTVNVARKFKPDWSGRLPVRFVILSNELPNFGDTSDAVANRFLVLSMHLSWLGKEDPGLTAKLRGELSGILNWSLVGLARLAEQGRFTEPPESAEAVTTMKEIGSPTAAFVRERCCTLGADHSTDVDDLWSEWKRWCEESNSHVGTKATFGKNLQTVAPRVRRSKRDAHDADSSGKRRQIPIYTGIAVRPTMEDCPAHAAHAALAAPPVPSVPRVPGNSPLLGQHEPPSPNGTPAPVGGYPPGGAGDARPHDPRRRSGTAACAGCDRLTAAPADPAEPAYHPHCRPAAAETRKGL